MRYAALLIVLAAAAACSETRPSPVASPRLESGVTSSGGGGAQATGNQPNVGVNTRVAPAR